MSIGNVLPYFFDGDGDFNFDGVDLFIIRCLSVRVVLNTLGVFCAGSFIVVCLFSLYFGTIIEDLHGDLSPK